MAAPLRKFANLLNPVAQGFSPQSLRIDWSHPLAANLSFVAILNGREVRNLAGGETSSFITNAAVLCDPDRAGIVAPSNTVEELTPFGPGLTFPSTDNGKIDFGVSQVITEAQFTILAIANPAASGTLNQTAFSQRVSGGYQADLIFNSNVAQTTVSGGWCLFTADSDGTGKGADTATGVDGNYHVYVCGVTKLGVAICATDGVINTGTQTTTLAGQPWAAGQNVTLGGIAGSALDVYALDCSMPLCLVWNGRCLEPDEIAAISADPYQIFVSDESNLPAIGIVSATTQALRASSAAFARGIARVAGVTTLSGSGRAASFAKLAPSGTAVAAATILAVARRTRARLSRGGVYRKTQQRRTTSYLITTGGSSGGGISALAARSMSAALARIGVFAAAALHAKAEAAARDRTTLSGRASLTAKTASSAIGRIMMAGRSMLAASSLSSTAAQALLRATTTLFGNAAGTASARGGIAGKTLLAAKSLAAAIGPASLSKAVLLIGRSISTASARCGISGAVAMSARGIAATAGRLVPPGSGAIALALFAASSARAKGLLGFAGKITLRGASSGRAKGLAAMTANAALRARSPSTATGVITAQLAALLRTKSLSTAKGVAVIGGKIAMAAVSVAAAVGRAASMTGTVVLRAAGSARSFGAALMVGRLPNIPLLARSLAAAVGAAYQLFVPSPRKVTPQTDSRTAQVPPEK